MLLPILLAIILTGVATAALYLRNLRNLHARLGSQIKQTALSLSQTKSEVASLPSELIAKPAKFRFLHEIDAIPIPSSCLPIPRDLEESFTLLLRHNMLISSRMPQTWIFWLLLSRSRELRRTFTKQHISTLNFQEGDVICGIFRVVKRTPGHVEMLMGLPKGGFGGVSGLLIVRLGNATLASETVQWMPKRSGRKLPIETLVGRFLHEVAAWQILVSGVEYLQSLHDSESRRGLN